MKKENEKTLKESIYPYFDDDMYEIAYKDLKSGKSIENPDKYAEKFVDDFFKKVDDDEKFDYLKSNNYVMDLPDDVYDNIVYDFVRENDDVIWKFIEENYTEEMKNELYKRLGVEDKMKKKIKEYCSDAVFSAIKDYEYEKEDMEEGRKMNSKKIVKEAKDSELDDREFFDNFKLKLHKTSFGYYDVYDWIYDMTGIMPHKDEIYGVLKAWEDKGWIKTDKNKFGAEIFRLVLDERLNQNVPVVRNIPMHESRRRNRKMMKESHEEIVKVNSSSFKEIYNPNDRLNYKEISTFLKDNKDWRLPTKEEIMFIFDNCNLKEKTTHFGGGVTYRDIISLLSNKKIGKYKMIEVLNTGSQGAFDIRDDIYTSVVFVR